jgi:orotidine-5'-phosphate decarboxylase
LNFRERLIEKIKQKKSIVCVGLDPDLNSEFFPQFLLEDKNPKLKFAKMIIDAVKDIVAVIKPNTRFYFLDELDELKSIVQYAHKHDLEVIGDCKENDIGHTMEMAYKKQFDGFDFDALTINGFFGSDGVIGTKETPIFKKWFEKGKGLFVLIKTSNNSSSEIQDLMVKSNGKDEPLYQYISSLVEKWSSNYEFTIGGVVGITQPENLQIIRKTMNGILLLPGFGAQGGKAEYLKNLVSGNKWVIVNSSRGIMYAHELKFHGCYSEEEFAKASKIEVEIMSTDINKFLNDDSIYK